MPRTPQWVGLLALSLTTTTACKSFDDYNTFVEGEIPEGCVDCVFTVNNVGSDAYTEEGILDGIWIITDGYTFTHDPGGDNRFDIEIDWRFDVGILVDPTKIISLSFVTIKDSIYSGFADEDQTILSVEQKLKPCLGYEWDTVSNTLEPNGECSDRRVEDDGGGSYGGGSGDCFVGTWTRPLDTCDDPQIIQTWRFSGNGSGSVTNPLVEGYGPSCTALCDATIYFDWVNNGNGTVRITQKSTSNTCGFEDLAPSSSEDASISCNSGSITINGLTYTN